MDFGLTKPELIWDHPMIIKSWSKTHQLIKLSLTSTIILDEEKLKYGDFAQENSFGSA
jgi:hypothetical protein